MHKLFLGGLYLINKSDLKWFFNWCKQKPTILLKIIQGTIEQLIEHGESESVFLQRVHGLRVQILALHCENKYLMLVKVTLFEKVIEHNLIYNHNLFVCQELINSGMFLIFLDILKLFIGGRNSFIIEEIKKLGLYMNANLSGNRFIEYDHEHH